MSPRTRSSYLSRGCRPSACLVLCVVFGWELGGGQADAQSTDNDPGIMFPVPFSRVVEKRLLIDGELDHRWAVRESYWDHWLILESAPSRLDGSGSATNRGVRRPTVDGTAPSSGRRRMIDLETGDVVEIDWAAGSYWRSTQARLNALTRRLRRAEGQLFASATPEDAAHSFPPASRSVAARRTGRRVMDVAYEDASGVEPTHANSALDGLDVDARLLVARGYRPMAPSETPRTVPVQVRRLSLRSGPTTLQRSERAEAPAERRDATDALVLSASVWVDERVALSPRAVGALESLADGTDPFAGLITISRVAAEAREFADGALPLAAEATIRLHGPPSAARVATLVESTVALEALHTGAALVLVPPQLREVSPPLEAVVRRAESERRLDEGRQR